MAILLGATLCSGSGKLICRAVEASQSCGARMGCSCAPPRTQLHPGRDLGIEDDKAFLWHGGKPPWDIDSMGEKIKGNENNPRFSISAFPKGVSSPVKCSLPYNSSQPYWLSLKVCSNMRLSTSGAMKKYKAWWVTPILFSTEFSFQMFFSS